MAFQDILYTKEDGIARLTINRPKVYNAYTVRTLQELCTALMDAWNDARVGVVVLTGAGDKAFCTGGDQKVRSESGYGTPDEGISLHVLNLQSLIIQIPKPVIAAVNGFAIGGGHVLQVVCDLSIASETATFGQSGPRVGSLAPGWGTAYLARLVGQKRAREMWYLCHKYSAPEALEMGLVNRVVPPEKLAAAVDEWCKEILAKSPTALRIAKATFNADLLHMQSIHALGAEAVKFLYQSAESNEGKKAFLEKRAPDFSLYRK